MTVDDFIHELEAPLYVYKMAKANLHSDNPSMVKSAKTRMKNSKQKIQNAVFSYDFYMEDRDR